MVLIRVQLSKSMPIKQYFAGPSILAIFRGTEHIVMYVLGGLGLKCAANLALPAFIASRIDSRAAVVSLMDELFGDDLGELLTTTFDNAITAAIGKLKSRLSDAYATFQFTNGCYNCIIKCSRKQSPKIISKKLVHK